MTRFGWSYLSDFKVCPYRWWLRNHRPHPSGGTGLEPLTTASPLLIGSATHEGLAAWYKSGWKGGEDTGARDLDAAIESARTHFAKRRSEFATTDDFDDGWATTSRLIQSYHAWFGPVGPEPDFPLTRVMGGPDGEPLVEREFQLDLGYGGHVLTARFDLVAHSFGHPSVFEHKTSAATGVGRLIDRMSIGGQPSAQLLILGSYLGDAGGDVTINILVKNRGSKSNLAPFVRHPTGRTPEELDRFRRDAVRTLKRIDDSLGEWHQLMASGMDSDEAALVAFDGSPDTQACVGFSRCSFYGPCKSTGYQSHMLDTIYRARMRELPEEHEV
jgi:hypothetical protein